MSELRAALKQMKNREGLREDQATSEMLKTGGETSYKVLILLNKCLKEGRIPETWRNAEVTIIFKKGDSTNIENYRLIRLLPILYKLLTKIIINRLTNELDFYQPVEQAGFRKRSVEIWAALHAMDTARIDSRYSNIIRNIYENATFHIGDLVNEKISIERGVRQGDIISPKLLILTLVDVFKNLTWERKGIIIDGKFLSHLCFADKIILMSTDAVELGDMLRELKEASEAVDLV